MFEIRSFEIESHVESKNKLLELSLALLTNLKGTSMLGAAQNAKALSFHVAGKIGNRKLLLRSCSEST